MRYRLGGAQGFAGGFYTPALGGAQGFAERKVLFLHSLIQVAKDAHNAAVRRQRLAAAAPPKVKDPSTSVG